ncbi:uncharacterized protein LOC131891560 [Tigriopus californicus]|uniref:uncharacterized protein LOC131891560 n=1 Tax=Tigriopus californicus TaxID=6832 RepID=UPI0027DA028D|nr:uncharacterized protein LOC131891560 [Tigriopus californicus]
MWILTAIPAAKSGLNSLLVPMGQKGVLFLAICAVLVSTGGAIKCWECNSKYDARCGDPFSNYSVAMVDCDQRQDQIKHLDIKDGEELPKATICRKTYQSVEGDVRVVRGCGWLENIDSLKDRECFNRAGTNQIQVYHCICKEDGCNSAKSLTSGLLIALLLPLIPAFF